MKSPGSLWRFTLLALISLGAVADEDWQPPVVRVEKMYEHHDAVGRMKVVLTRDGDREKLEVDCRLFSAVVPSQGLADLPRPDWGALGAFTGGSGEDRYVYVSVPLFGPPGEAWEQTWVTFHFDSRGKLTRKIKRFEPETTVNGVKFIRVLWKEWTIGAGIPVQAALGLPTSSSASHAATVPVDPGQPLPTDGSFLAGEWSAVAGGVQIRMVLEQAQAVSGVRMLVPYLDIRNIGDLGTPLALDLSKGHLALNVVDQSGADFVPSSQPPRSGPFVPLEGVVVPRRSFLRVHLGSTNWGHTTEAAAQISTENSSWLLKDSERGTVFLVASLKGSALPAANRTGRWQGELQTPPLRIDWTTRD